MPKRYERGYRPHPGPRRGTGRDRCLIIGAITLFILSLFAGSGPDSATPQPKMASVVPSDRQTDGWKRRSLEPVPNPDPTAPPQPARCRPHHVAVASNKAYVTLSGKEIAPGSEVAVVDIQARREIGRVPVGSHPVGLATHPSGRWIVVANRYSNFLSVIDVDADSVVSEIPVPFYSEDLVFAPDGRTAYVSNFWKDQILVVDLWISAERLTGRLRRRGFNRDTFFGSPQTPSTRYVCELCGWEAEKKIDCLHCQTDTLVLLPRRRSPSAAPGSIHGLLRARCGTAGCHLYRAGGFYAGSDAERAFQSATAHAFSLTPEASPLLRATTGVRHGGYADAADGRHHTGKVVFKNPVTDPDYRRLIDWIATGPEGPGIPVGDAPRDLVLSPDGTTLFVANTGSLDISVVDLATGRETRRIFTRSPVNDLLWCDGRLVLATLGVGSGHPKEHDAGRESLDRTHPEAEFTLFRDPETARPLPLSQQKPLGPYDDVDGTAQEKFRDITNDLVVLDPACSNVAAYQATEEFTRYTSDSFEALPGDKKGDVPSDLLKVVGSFPEQMTRRKDRLWVTMSGTFQVAEWVVDMEAEPASRLVFRRTFNTGFKPTGLALAGNVLVVCNSLGESVTFIDLETGETDSLSLSRISEPFPANDFERGEFFVQTSVFSVDQDQSCVHCHYRDTSDGQRWSVSQVMGQSRHGEERTGGSREVPDLRVLVQKTPFFLEGILSLDEPLTMMMEHNPLVDFQGRTPAGDFRNIFATPAEEDQYTSSADSIVVATGKKWKKTGVRLVDLVKRREIHFRKTSRKQFGEAYSFRDFQRFIGAFQAGEPRLLPNPVDATDERVQHGRALFESPKVGCTGCHPPPTFTDKQHVHNPNRAFPPLVSAAPRDHVHTLVSADRLDALNGYTRWWDPDDKGRVEYEEGFFVAPSLRGIWARPPRFLHHGHATGLRQVIATPNHPSLRPGEKGLNERDGLPDTHGTTSHLSVWDMECLLRFLRAIE